MFFFFFFRSEKNYTFFISLFFFFKKKGEKFCSNTVFFFSFFQSSMIVTKKRDTQKLKVFFHRSFYVVSTLERPNISEIKIHYYFLNKIFGKRDFHFFLLQYHIFCLVHLNIKKFNFFI